VSGDKAVVVADDNKALQIGAFSLQRVGLIVEGEPTYEEWEAVGQSLQHMQGSVHWWIGDYARLADAQWGEKYDQLMGDTGFSYDTIRRDRRVAERVQFGRRRRNLSHAHHIEVAMLAPEQQDELLQTAEEQDWSHKRLRQAVRELQREALPAPAPALRAPHLIVCPAEDMAPLANESVDLIITSPPYNLGEETWPMGGDGRQPRYEGIGYQDHMDEALYWQWQVGALNECHRVAKPGASMFYVHKVRQKGGGMIHPLDWLRSPDNPWIIRQEIIWDRGSTHNHCPVLFWQEDERIYWLTKGTPTLPKRPIDVPTVWQCHGPVAGTWHPAPFPPELPIMCIKGVGREGLVVLDPFAGSCTTLAVALEYGYEAIGVDISDEYLERACKEYGWPLQTIERGN